MDFIFEELTVINGIKNLFGAIKELTAGLTVSSFLLVFELKLIACP